MSANPIDKKTTPNTTGSLEALFRHHLGEEAAVPPRPMLWDQIDNSLLIRQNETYRRRLVATRWVAAASLLLATLAGSGWWATRYAGIGGTGVATISRQTNAGIATNARTILETGTTAPAGSAGRRASSGGATTTGTTAANAAANRATASTTAATGGITSIDDEAASGSAGHYTGFGTARRADLSKSVATGGNNGGHSRFGSIARGASAKSGTLGNSVNAAFAARSSQAADTSSDTDGLTATTSPVATAAPAAGRASAVGSIAASAPAIATAATSGVVAGTAAATTVVAAAPAAAAEVVTGEMGLLAVHPAALSMTSLTDLPNGLATLTLPAETEPIVPPAARKWSYGTSYTAATFNPNINFSRAGIGSEYAYNPALGSDSPALTEAAAAQYRDNLRPGLSQRLALLATRHLAGHWSLSTGVEFTQATAKSASTAGFVGEQLYDLGSYSTGPRRTTDFRYRLASIPIELRYGNPAKRGWSLYGRFGGVVSALLGVRSEVQGNPEATRTYSIFSAGAPYRRMLGSLRGGAGAQFRPGSGSWAFTLGPVAELGLMSLNAHPAQSYLAQSRPYSFGIEAGMEFGR